MGLLDEFETEISVRETVSHLPTGPKATGKFEWQDGTHGTWHTGFSSRRAAIIDAAHRLLHTAQRYGRPEHYNRLLTLVWSMPCPMKWAAKWESDFRPQRPLTEQIPDPRRAPKTAIKWGMDPILAMEGKARAQVVKAIDARRCYQLDRILLYGGKASLSDSDWVVIMAEISARCDLVRRTGLGESFGLL